MSILDTDQQPFEGMALERHIHLALQVSRPAGPLFELSNAVFKRLFKPQLLGIDNIPAEPCLFIGNHSLFASDGYILAPLMWMEERRFLRALADRALWHPLTERFLLSQGAVVGHPDVCTALMQKGCDLMVFPGGAHEATKTQDQRYQLQWKERYGFLRMAAAHNYPIVPMAIVGPDEFYDHAIEGHDLPDTPVGEVLRNLGLLNDRTRRDLIPPLPLGALGSPFPKPQYCYIQFGEPLRPEGRGGKPPGMQALKTLRQALSGQIETMLEELFALRDEDRNQQGCVRSLLTR